jgi:hypothetical protein
MSFPQWGDVPTWGLLVGAAVTAFFAGRAFSTQSKQLRDQQKINEGLAEVLPLQARELRESIDERKRLSEDQRRAQANKVAAWFDYLASLPLQGGPPLVAGWGAKILNASDLPILDVTTTFYFVSDPGTGQPWTPIDRGHAMERILVLPPGEEQFIPIPEVIANMIKTIGREVYVVGIEFTDAAGYRWERDARGSLQDRGAAP